MELQLRWFQQESMDAVLSTSLQNPIVGLPTGAGKALMIGRLIRELIRRDPEVRVIMAVHTSKLVSQNVEEFLTQCTRTADLGVACADLGRRQFKNKIVFGTVGTLANNLPALGVRDWIIIDECHRVSDQDGTGYNKLIRYAQHLNPAVRVVGLSATPWREKEGHLADGETFDDIIYDITRGDDFIRLVDEGILCPLTTRASKNKVDLRNVGIIAGEFNGSQAAKAVRDALSATLPEMLASCVGRGQGMVFVSGIENTEYVNEWLNANGETSVCVHSKMPRAAQLQAFKTYADDEARWIVSADKLTTGFNHKNVHTIVLLRPVNSSSLHVQMIGRGTRLHPSKTETLILDFVGNLGRCGPINDPVIPGKKIPGKAGGTAPERECEVCKERCHASIRMCPYCGFEFPPGDVKITSYASDAEAMRRTKPLKMQRKHVWLYHPPSREAMHVKDSHGREYVRMVVDDGFSFLIDKSRFAEYGIDTTLTVNEAVAMIQEHGIAGGMRLWDVSDGKYPRHVRAKKRPSPVDLYWFPAITETAQSEFIRSILDDTPMDENIVKATLRSAKSRLIKYEHCVRQAQILRQQLLRRDMLNTESVTMYVNNIVEQAREAAEAAAAKMKETEGQKEAEK